MVLLVRAEEAQRLFQHRNVNRLGKVHVHARIHALLDIVRKGVRGHRDNSRGNCGEQVHTDDEDEVDGPAATAAKTRKGGITDERN